MAARGSTTSLVATWPNHFFMTHQSAQAQIGKVIALVAHRQSLDTNRTAALPRDASDNAVCRLNDLPDRQAIGPRSTAFATCPKPPGYRAGMDAPRTARHSIDKRLPITLAFDGRKTPIATSWTEIPASGSCARSMDRLDRR